MIHAQKIRKNSQKIIFVIFLIQSQHAEALLSPGVSHFVKISPTDKITLLNSLLKTFMLFIFCYRLCSKEKRETWSKNNW